MKLDRFVRSILKSIGYMMEEAADRVDRVSNRASEFAETTRHVLHPDEGNTVRHFVSFAAGVGVGIAAGLLLAQSVLAPIRSDMVQSEPMSYGLFRRERFRLRHKLAAAGPSRRFRVPLRHPLSDIAVVSSPSPLREEFLSRLNLRVPAS